MTSYIALVHAMRWIVSALAHAKKLGNNKKQRPDSSEHPTPPDPWHRAEGFGEVTGHVVSYPVLPYHTLPRLQRESLTAFRLGPLPRARGKRPRTLRDALGAGAGRSAACPEDYFSFLPETVKRSSRMGWFCSHDRPACGVSLLNGGTKRPLCQTTSSLCFSDSEVSFWSGWNCPARCSGGRRPLIAECLSLQRLGVDSSVTRPVWDSNLGPPACESRSLTIELSVQLRFIQIVKVRSDLREFKDLVFFFVTCLTCTQIPVSVK